MTILPASLLARPYFVPAILSPTLSLPAQRSELKHIQFVLAVQETCV
jgi:hypothetical protein